MTQKQKERKFPNSTIVVASFVQVIVFHKIDRIGRRTKQLSNTLEIEFFRKGREKPHECQFSPIKTLSVNFLTSSNLKVGMNNHNV